MRCLLDSSCERSIIAADLAPHAKLTPSQYSLLAANRASLDVLGDMVIPFVIDGHNFEADVSVSNKVEDFLLGSDWLKQQGARWDFAHGTVTLGDKCIIVHHRHHTGICRCIVIAHDCVVPDKRKANVPMHMEDDGITLPPGDWAIEQQGLGPGVMAAHTLFSNSQSQLVARVLNNSLKPKMLSANSLLSMAEPVQCLSGTGCEPNDSLFADSNACCYLCCLMSLLCQFRLVSSQQWCRRTGMSSSRQQSLPQLLMRQTRTHQPLLQEINWTTSTACCAACLRT